MHAFGIDGFAVMVAGLVAALPSAGSVFIFALRYEADGARLRDAGRYPGMIRECASQTLWIEAEASWTKPLRG